MVKLQLLSRSLCEGTIMMVGTGTYHTAVLLLNKPTCKAIAPDLNALHAVCIALEPYFKYLVRRTIGITWEVLVSFQMLQGLLRPRKVL